MKGPKADHVGCLVADLGRPSSRIPAIPFRPSPVPKRVEPRELSLVDRDEQLSPLHKLDRVVPGEPLQLGAALEAES